MGTRLRRPLMALFALCLTLAPRAADAAVPQYQILDVTPTQDVKGAATVDGKSPVSTSSIAIPHAILGQGYGGEVEPNGTTATASPHREQRHGRRAASLFPNGDVDYYRFTAAAGDRVYAAAMTSFSAGSSTDSQLTLLASDGTTVIEFDDDNGSLRAALSSSIAGATIPAPGTYFLQVNDFTAGTTTASGRTSCTSALQSGAPTPEVEANDTPATANPLPANGWVSGTRNPAARDGAGLVQPHA